jgi:hypothetical protein
MEAERENISDPVSLAAIIRSAKLPGISDIEPESLVQVTGRNNNWIGRDDSGNQIFLKSLTGPSQETLQRFRRSLEFENSVHNASTEWWRAPEYLGGSEDLRLLSYRGVDEAVSAAALMLEDGFHTTFAERCGKALAEVHSLGVSGQARTPGGSKGSRFMSLSVDEYTEASGAELEAWTILQHDQQLIVALDDLGRQSAATRPTACHGDLRLDQFLLAGEDLYIIDWEEFRAADPAIDIGSFAGEWLHRAAWLMFSELDTDPALSPMEIHETLVRRGERELELVRPFVTAFWDGYRSLLDIDAEGLAVRSTAYAGWHLFDRMLAGSMASFHLSHVERGMAGIGRTALMEPEEFSDVIGLTWE